MPKQGVLSLDIQAGFPKWYWWPCVGNVGVRVGNVNDVCASVLDSDTIYWFKLWNISTECNDICKKSGWFVIWCLTWDL